MNAPPLAPLHAPITVCVLCYGDHPELARRILSSLLARTERYAIRLRIGLNAIGKETEAILQRLLPQFDAPVVIRSETNLYKAAMMRRLFHDQPIVTDWTLWFDDDSFVFRPDWLSMLSCESRLRPRIDMWGLCLEIKAGELHHKFVQDAPWYRGIDLPNGNRDGEYRFRFVAGGFWAIRTKWIYSLDWPDRRLLHFGDDYILGEALRQNGGRIGHAFSGIAINCSRRRAPAGTPSCEVLN